MSGRFIRAATGMFAAVILFTGASATGAAEKQYTVTSSDGVTIAVEETGNPEGQPIVFVHGLLGSRINWDSQTADPDLQKFRLITFDLRGHGLSAKPDDADAYKDGDRWADDLDAVLRGSGATNPVLVGWSLGGVVLSNYLPTTATPGLAASFTSTVSSNSNPISSRRIRRSMQDWPQRTCGRISTWCGPSWPSALQRSQKARRLNGCCPMQRWHHG
ncbi:alpha/beta fold hydrolase [Agrobacterium sp. S2]|nr:alpha/beta fold hydrolase [Agrobacterium sp. S2]